jgi:hypothetical protein
MHGKLTDILARMALSAIAVALTVIPVRAQEQQFGFGEYAVEGVAIYCGDIYTLVRSGETELIYALDYEHIVINGPVFDTLSPGIRLFAYYQTCGQIFYGDATLADTSAVRRGVRDRWLTASDVETMCGTDALAVAGWSAAPDAARCQNIFQVMRAALQ